MRIAVMGAGSTGGYFGAMLARAGNEVALIARGAHLEAIKSNGLRVIRDDEEFMLRCRVTDDPKEIGPVNLALICVKTYQNEEAVPLMNPLLGPDTAVLCLQNGVDSYRAAAAILGKASVIPGAAFIEAAMPEPGVVRQSGSLVRIILGEIDGRESERCCAIRSVFQGARIPAEVTTDITAGLWTKFLFIATMAGVTAMARSTLAELMPQPDWRRMILACMVEIEAVGRASGVDLPQDIVLDTVKYIEEHLADLHASMHTDLVAGRPLELDALNGTVVRAGKEAGVPTPVNDMICAMLSIFERGS